jgi:hypothetical protein
VKHTGSSTLSSFIFSRLVAWIFLLSLGALLFYGVTSLPPLGDTNPTFHVASRYLDHGAKETGFASSFLAVLLDYRSFDLILFDLFFLALTLTILLFCVVENLPIRPSNWIWASVSLFSSLMLFVLGWIGLKNGSNFMDYEFWSGPFGASARVHGAWITGGLVLLTILASLRWAWKTLVLGKKKRLDL